MKTCRVSVLSIMNGRNGQPVQYTVYPVGEELSAKYPRLRGRNIRASVFSEKLKLNTHIDLMLSDEVYNASYDAPISEVESYSIVGGTSSTTNSNTVSSASTTTTTSTSGNSANLANQPNISSKHKMITFGYQVFEASSMRVYTPNGLEFEWGKETDTQGIVGQKPISYIKSIALIRANFRIHSSRFLGSDPEAVRAAWAEMAENNMTYGFLVGSEYVGTRFIVKSVKMSNTRYNGKGKLISADFDISVEEYAGENYKLSILQEPSDYS